MSTRDLHTVRLGGTRWRLWRDAVLRAPGFPATRVRELCDDELAAAGAESDDALRAVWEPATGRLSAAIRSIAHDPLFREAVAWQNAKLLRDCVDRAAAGEPRNVRGRNHELAIAGYWQRYCVKNDTIGYFGPVGWARFTDDADRPVHLEVGGSLLSRRTVYFEVWAIDAVAEAMAADPRVLPWLRPRRVHSHLLTGRVVHRPTREPVMLTDAEAEVIALCDGKNAVHDIVEELTWSGLPEFADGESAVRILTDLRTRELIRLDLEGSVCSRPELELRAKLEAIGDPALRAELLSRLDALMEARDAVAAAAGDEARLLAAIERANQVFEATAGVPATRKPGVVYGGRTILYEDCVRDVRLELGPEVTDALAVPLGQLLDSARWYVAEAARRYEHVFAEAYQRAVQRTGRDPAPLAAVLSNATPYLFFSLRQLAAPVREVTAELQRRWEKILRVADGTSRHQVAAADIAEAVRREFDSSLPPAWSAALHHSPDVMLLANGPDALARGDYTFVLGEMHLASNTMESRLFVEQHAVPADVLAADETDHGDRRVYLVPPKHWQSVNSRTYPPSALLSEKYTYWSLHDDSGGVPGDPIPVTDLFVTREPSGRLVVQTTDGSRTFPLLEVVGDLISAAVVNGFKPVRKRSHQPRITVDRMVIAREAWTFGLDDLAWVRVKDERARYRAMCRWRAEAGLPERVFYKLATEDKPTFVDFTSLVYTNIVAKGVRAMIEAGQGGDVTFSEMLPELEDCWLTDHSGSRYTAELRLVVVDPAAQQG
ncbi:lantibiotic dehydratase [Krasilnikovia sp. M28-CT-15]|uniref:lantibiotic dehydratase n=1 Tax=Krasilnikovia sp. M28-CT-15 TaxID=3373540 RepID=UPI0038762229